MAGDRRTDAFEAIGRIFAGFQFSAPGAAGRVLEQLRPWVTELTIAAVPRWLPRLALGMPCHVATKGPHGPVRCPSHAVGLCVVCEQPACLRHAFVAVSGDVVCYVCASRHAKAPAGGQPPPGPGAAPPQDPPTPKADLAAARRVLGVKKSASWPDIQAAYRQKVLKTHPDRGGSDDAFRRVQQAYELLKKEHEKSPN